MAGGFNMLNATQGLDLVDAEKVRGIRVARGVTLLEAKKIAKTEALYERLSAMRSRQEEFEDANCCDILDSLLDMLMSATEYNT